MRFIFFLFSFSIAAGCYAQSDSTVPFVAYWKKGEQRKLSITKISEKGDAKKPLAQTKLEFEATITVLDSTANGFLVEWVYNVPEKLKQEDPFLAQALSMYMDMKIRFFTTETGTFKELKNWEDLRDFYIGMYEKSIPADQDSVTKLAIAKTKELFNSKEMVEASLIKEVQLYHMPYGYVFTVKELKAESEFPNPFGGEPIPAVQTFRVKDLHPASDLFTLIVKQDIDAAAGKKLMESILSKMVNVSDKEMEEVRQMLSSFKIFDHSEYVFIRSSGWVKKLHFTRSAQSEQFWKIEQYIIELKE